MADEVQRPAFILGVGRNLPLGRVVNTVHLREYPGWLGVHTRDEAPGALKNGSRIRKVKFEAGDGHPIGTLGRVLGSIEAPADVFRQFGARFFYFVEWDPKPRVAVGVASSKIGPA